MGLLITVIMVGVMGYSLYSGEVPARRRRSVSRAESPAYYWFLVALQAALALLGVLDYLGVVTIFGRG